MDNIDSGHTLAWTTNFNILKPKKELSKDLKMSNFLKFKNSFLLKTLPTE